MAIGGGMSCVKYLLFCFNLLFAITGLIILIVGAKEEINASPYKDLTDETFFTSGPVILIIVGVIIFVIAFFGCCGAVKENHCMIVTYSVFLLLIFAAELGVGIAGYVKRDDLEASVMRRLNETIKEYSTNVDVQKTFDIVQTDLQCCGIHSYQDWITNNQPIPNSCCQFLATDQPTTCTADNAALHKVGCLEALSNHYADIAAVLGGGGLGIAAIQLLGVIFACCLARSIRNQYETV